MASLRERGVHLGAVVLNQEEDFGLVDVLCTRQKELTSRLKVSGRRYGAAAVIVGLGPFELS
jgi:hypothetical protein